MKRYIFAVVPLMCISAVYCVFVLRDRVRVTMRKAVTALLVASLILPTTAVSYSILNYVEYKGKINQAGEIFESFDNDSILIFVDAYYSHVAYPLRAVYDKNALLLRRDFWGGGRRRAHESGERGEIHGGVHGLARL